METRSAALLAREREMSSNEARGYNLAKDGLLSHRKISPAQKAMYRLNAQQSPLLRLSLEVRQRIYELVLGGHHIQIETGHIMWLTWQDYFLWRGTPNDPRLTHECAPMSQWCHEPSSMVSPINNPPDYPLYQVTPLAGVCRQLHQETSLLLYQLNIFTFTSVLVMRKWLESLKPVQVRALRRVLLPWRALARGGWQKCLYHQHRKHLTGLVEVYDWNRETRVVERKWEGPNFDDVLIPMPPPRGQARRVQPPVIYRRPRRNPYRGLVASRASSRLKSLSVKGRS